MLTIDIETARRFVLGKQGLWPGRRWQGVDGTEQAMRGIEYLQLDPLQIVARSHDIMLNSRVIDYRVGMWEDLAYGQRKFFDWGAWLAVRPMDELPYWRTVMHRVRDSNYEDSRIRKIGLEHAEAIAEMRDILRERGTVTNRDFEKSTRAEAKVYRYRGSKDSSLALYYLWYTGDVMTHHRAGFERVYALTEAVAPEYLIRDVGEDETDRFLIKKEIGFDGLTKFTRASDSFRRGEPYRAAKKLLATMLGEGEVLEVQVQGWKPIRYMLASDAPLLDEVIAGRVPESWKPIERTAMDEAVFLAPLDPVSARGRAKELFGFDFVWEVYKPEHLRKYGYYALPILWGDKLVGRFDSKLDRTTNTFVVLGLWLDDPTLGKDESFAEALARGFKRFQTFIGAKKIDSKAIRESVLRKRVGAG